MPTVEAMERLGRELAAVLRAGDLVVLSGDLGAGKTALTRGIGAGLRVRGPVTSPTFVLARVHPPLAGGPALVHVDAYRLAGADLRAQIDDLDLDAELEAAVTVVEWGAGGAEQLAEDRLEAQLTRRTEDDVRLVELRPVGPRWARVPLPDPDSAGGRMPNR